MSFIRKDIIALEQALNYKFKNLNLLQEALSHPSLKQHDRLVRDYERLEMLGDSILGFLVVEMIFNEFRDYEEGDISKIKSYLVSRETISKVALKLNLAEYIIMTQGEEKSGGRNNLSNLENTMEAVLAAVYLDSNLDCARLIVQNFWGEYIKNIDFNFINPKSALQEFMQDLSHKTPIYEVIKSDGPMHAPTFTVQVKAGDITQVGHGKTIKEAEKTAAKLLLNKLKNKHES